MNKVILMGNITKDIELRNTPSGVTVANFGLATNDPVKKSDGTWENLPTFHNIVAWKSNAENIAKFFSKGSKILIEGSIKKRDWTDKNGVKRTETEVLLDRFEFVESKKTSETGDKYSQPDTGHDYSQPEVESEEIKIEDIPF